MKAHLVQLNIQWESAQANYERVRSLIEAASPTAGDLIALPELFDSGFSLNTKSIYDSESKTLDFLTSLARDTQCTIQGSRSLFPNSDQSQLALNAATVVNQSSPEPICEYFKIHPFSMGNETKSYQGGDQLQSYHWGTTDSSLQVCPAICYDLRFPELFRKAAIDGSQMFVLGANWPKQRMHHWRALLIARAIENQAFVLGINRCGDDPYLQYTGGSIAIDPTGEILGELGDQEQVLSVEIDPKILYDWRAKFPVLDDIKIHNLNQ